MPVGENDAPRSSSESTRRGRTRRASAPAASAASSTEAPADAPVDRGRVTEPVGQGRRRRSDGNGNGRHHERRGASRAGRGASEDLTSVLDALEPGPTASLHPKELARHGVKAGEQVRVTTRRGSIELTARADRWVREGMIFIPFAYVEAAANILTNPRSVNLLRAAARAPQSQLPSIALRLVTFAQGSRSVPVNGRSN